jgi:GrpB-like predicted nucleotidyltransferase (UPF0157 family)
MPDEINIVPYDPNWPIIFYQEKALLENALDDNIIEIIHFGSTAVTGLSAKPIIDIMIIVKSFIHAKDYIPILQALNYVYWDQDPKGSKRMFFVKGMPPYGKQRTHHIHIIQSDNEEFLSHLNFCQYLNDHPNIAKQYENLKKDLSLRYINDREAYTQAKTDFINLYTKSS